MANVRTRKESAAEIQEVIDIGSTQTLVETMAEWFRKEELSEFVDKLREEVYGY
jgi:hypothetical protein